MGGGFFSISLRDEMPPLRGNARVESCIHRAHTKAARASRQGLVLGLGFRV
jgi:hypothetical protein